MPTPTATRRARRCAATSITNRQPDVRAELLGLVAAVDRASYDAADPDDADAATAWQYCRTVVGALDAGRSPWQRLRMRLDPRPLLRRDAWQRAQAGDPPSHEATTSVPIADMVDQ